MAPRWNSIETAVDTIILNIFAIQTAFVHEILTKLLIYVVDDDAPTIFSVNSIAIARRIDNVQSQSHTFFFDVQRLLFDSRRLLATLFDRCHLLLSICSVRQVNGAEITARKSHLTVLVKISEKKTVDERRLSQARLSNDYQCELEATFHRFSVYLIGQWCESNVITFAICKRERERKKTNCRMNALCREWETDNKSRTNWKCVIVKNAENCLQYKVIRRCDNECYGVETLLRAHKKALSSIYVVARTSCASRLN